MSIRGIGRLSFSALLLVSCGGGGTAPPPAAGGARPVAAVTVEPALPSLTVGDTVRLTATTKDSDGAVLTGRSVAWSTGNAGAATVSSTGLVTAVAAGGATVTATSEGKTGSATVTVTTASGGANECATPQAGWIWCDDFEQDRLASYFEYVSSGGQFTRAAGVGRTGSVGMRSRWASSGQVGAGALHLAFGRTPQVYFRPVDAGSQDYRELFWRLWLRLQPGWTGGGADKLSRVTIFASPSSWAQAMAAHVWSGGPGADQDYLLVDPASGTDSAGVLRTTTYNDVTNFRWLGYRRGVTPLFAPQSAGTWRCVEAHVRLNDAGQLNGVFDLWIDGSPEVQRTGLNWVGAFSTYGINALFIENYWNAGAPQPEERYIDNLVVSTARIGC